MKVRGVDVYEVEADVVVEVEADVAVEVKEDVVVEVDVHVMKEGDVVVDGMMDVVVDVAVLAGVNGSRCWSGRRGESGWRLWGLGGWLL